MPATMRASPRIRAACIALAAAGVAMLAGTAHGAPAAADRTTTPPRIGVIDGTRAIAGGDDTERPLDAAIARDGDPTTRPPTDDIVCDVRRRGLGDRCSFSDLGGLDPCSDAGGLVGSAVLTGPRRRTTRGVRVGDPTSRIRRRPGAFRCDRRFLRAPERRRGRAAKVSRAGRRAMTADRRRRSSGRSATWWLAPVYDVAGSFPTYSPRITIVVRKGRVASFRPAIGAGGE